MIKWLSKYIKWAKRLRKGQPDFLVIPKDVYWVLKKNSKTILDK